MDRTFVTLLRDIRARNACKDSLQLSPKPIVQLNPAARILVIAQAPGRRARASGSPFDDASGDRLRSWLGVDRTVFYDENCFACMPMGFCYPGTNKSGDLPPCKQCAPLWHPQITPYLTAIKLTLLVGSYAHRHYLTTTSVRDAVANYQTPLNDIVALPHPSWHNTNWLKQHRWFEDDVLPMLKARVKHILTHNDT